MSNDLGERQLVAEAAGAMAQGRDADALVVLTRCLAQYPGCAAAHHLLAAQHAQSGRYDDARQHFVLALHYAPEMHEARLQLGLLLLTLNEARSASSVLRAVPPASVPPALASYLAALCAVSEERPVDALALLDEGLAVGHSNLALNADMRRLREQVQQGISGAQPALGDDGSTDGVDSHVLLRSYSARQI